MMANLPRRSLRPTQAELDDIDLLIEAGVARTTGGVIHRALEVGFRVLKTERGLIPQIETE